MRVIIAALTLMLMLSSVEATMAPAISAEPPKQEPVKQVGCIENPTSLSEVQDCIKFVFGDDYKMALQIACAESRFKQSAVHYNRDESGEVWSIDTGIFQINSYYHKGSTEFNTVENIKYAHYLYKRDGWTAWSVYNNGLYKQCNPANPVKLPSSIY